jgi:hypothetical protein
MATTQEIEAQRRRDAIASRIDYHHHGDGDKYREKHRLQRLADEQSRNNNPTAPEGEQSDAQAENHDRDPAHLTTPSPLPGRP